MSRIEKNKNKKEEQKNKILKFFQILSAILGSINGTITLIEHLKG